MTSQVAARKAVLVVGVPRSGTTWVARVLAHTEDTTYLEEPDNHFRFAYAFRVKRRMQRGEYPMLSVADSAAEYEALWRQALTTEQASFGWVQGVRRRVASRLLASASASEVSAAIAGRSRAGARLRVVERLALPERRVSGGAQVVVKSVYAPLALEWIAARFEPNVVVVIRHPLNVLSSWRTMGWLERTRHDMLDELDPRARRHLAETFAVQQPPSDASPIARAAWLSATLTSSLLTAATRHPNWHVVSHEQLCEQPHDRLSRLASELGLRWTSEVDRQVDALNRDGTGYEIQRVASELREVWRTRLTPEEAREASSVLDRFAVDGMTVRS